ncbi:hypothetical protein QAD02_001747 [Eretmocerus hayati]|uniref:Uncharacterized protein n=1 Tax=Eretmocerus hayati TaxID=131215 RepID=A0ACC2NI46_9HYME|nr:hypothetical protein QAD02_001747 [Eretmocerus hayati]
MPDGMGAPLRLPQRLEPLEQSQAYQQQHQVAAQLLRAHSFSRQRSSSLKKLPLGSAAQYNERCCWGLMPKRWFRCSSKGSAQIDVLARFIFPLAFVLFNIGYWSTYTGQDDDILEQK